MRSLFVIMFYFVGTHDRHIAARNLCPIRVNIRKICWKQRAGLDGYKESISCLTTVLAQSMVKERPS